MVSELEKQFFDTFGIDPFIYCSKPILDCDARKSATCTKDCEYYSGTAYPQITDTHYLKLISIMSKELSMIVNLLSEDIQELKSEILDKCIRNYHRHKEAFSEAHREYADGFKHQVRTLFKEG